MVNLSVIAFFVLMGMLTSSVGLSMSTPHTKMDSEKQKENESPLPSDNIDDNNLMKLIVADKHNHYKMSKRQTPQSDMGSSKRNLLKIRSFDVCFYPDHPDTDCSRINIKNASTIITNKRIEGGSKQRTSGTANKAQSPVSYENKTCSFCTYFHPDHPDIGFNNRRIDDKNSSAVIDNATNNSIVKQGVKQCKDSSVLCNYFYLGNSYGGRKKQSNYTPVVILIDQSLQDTSKVVNTPSTTTTTTPKCPKMKSLADVTKYCECDYHRGGCTISQAASPGFACRCVYKGFWICSGNVVPCSMENCLCANPDKSKAACELGQGECSGY